MWPMICILLFLSTASARFDAYTAQEAQSSSENDRPEFGHIISFKGEPAATYKGNLKDLPAMETMESGKKDFKHPKALEYTKYLNDKKLDVFNELEISSDKIASLFSVAINGAHVAELSRDELAKLKAHPDIESVRPVMQYKIHTFGSPAFLGLPDIWQQLGGVDAVGSNVVIGLLDTGIHPESPSFAPFVETSKTVDGFHGGCTSGQQFNPSTNCNNKLVGCKFYIDGFANGDAILAEYPEEIISCRFVARETVETRRSRLFLWIA
jgi:hypothetical protein